MYKSEIYEFLLKRIAASSSLQKKVEKNIAFIALEESFSPIMEVLKTNSGTSDLLVHNDIHQVCIHFDRERLAKSEDERDRFDNMLSENLSARKSILSILENPEGYRQEVEQAYAPYRKVLRPPAKEASIVAYKNISRQLGYLKHGEHSGTIKAYFTARQDMLRADIDIIVNLQRKALGLEFHQKQRGQGRNPAPGQ
jgi:hypothetical protein